MLFLVDYENVGNAGMKGSSYLNAADYIVVFYSETKKNMERRLLESITASGCAFEICKLCKTGKNALDFYIASRLGELFGSGHEGIAVIVSNDNGFTAVRDYWEKRAEHKRKVLLASCVEDGIVGSGENNERTKELKRLRENLTIGGYHAAYKEKMRINAVVQKLFEGTAFEDMTEEIFNLIEGKKKTSKEMYLSCLHLFGRNNGLEIYNTVKTCDEL